MFHYLALPQLLESPERAEGSKRRAEKGFLRSVFVGLAGTPGGGGGCGGQDLIY